MCTKGNYAKIIATPKEFKLTPLHNPNALLTQCNSRVQISLWSSDIYSSLAPPYLPVRDFDYSHNFSQ